MAWLARIATLALLLVAAGAFAACGGGDNTEENRYIRELTAAQTRFQTTQERLESDARKSKTPRQNRRALDRFAGAISDTIISLRKIDAPARIVPEHRRFIGVFVTLYDDVARFLKAVRNPTPGGFERARRRIAGATATFNDRSHAAAVQIDKKLGS
jgi:hypothetical protein